MLVPLTSLFVFLQRIFQIGDFAHQPSKRVFLLSVTMILACVVTQSLSCVVIKQVSLVRCFLRFSCLSKRADNNRPSLSGAEQHRDPCSDSNMENDTKAVMSDTQKPPGKTLLWTQQQHYT